MGYEDGQIKLEVDSMPFRPTTGNAIKSRALDNLLNVILNDDANDREKLVMIRLTCCDMYFTCEQVGLIEKQRIPEKNKDLKISAVIELIQRVVDPENMHFFYKELDDTVLEQVKRIIGQLYYFIADNPGDHYRLDLAKQYDRVILEKLLEINETDITYSKDTEACKRRDISQYGDFQNFRNVVYNDVKLVPPHAPLAVLFRKEVPRRGLLIFDYTQPKKQPTVTKSKTCTHKEYQKILKDLGILSDEEWAAYKIGTVIRGKIGRRRALQIAQQKRKIAEGHEAPEQIDVKKIVKIIHQIYTCAREYWNSNKEEHSIDTPPSELRQSFCVSLNDVIDDYLDELEEGEERDPLQKSILMDHVKIYQEANSFIRWFGSLSSALSSYIHEGLVTFTSQDAFGFFVQVYDKLMDRQ